jgi:putative transposase
LQAPATIYGFEGRLLKELTKVIFERALAAEMTDHLGYEKHDPAGLTGATHATGKGKRL